RLGQKEPTSLGLELLGPNDVVPPQVTASKGTIQASRRGIPLFQMTIAGAVAAVILVIVGIWFALASRKVALGQQVFNNTCQPCHSTKEGDNRFGPHLHHIIGRKVGSVPGYEYTSSMRDADFVWDDEKLDRFLAPGDIMKLRAPDFPTRYTPPSHSGGGPLT